MFEIEIDSVKPKPDELEITLMGPGSEAGESIVVHLANGQWMIVDSCLSCGEVLPLYYLHKKGVDLKDVAYVICTHWHSDHIGGLSKVVEECKNAILALPSFFKNEKVLETLIKDSVSRRSPIAREMLDCLDIIKNRKGCLRIPIFLGPRDEITEVAFGDIKVEVRSFSPSDHVKTLYDKMLAQSTLEKMSPTDLEPNMCSSVLDITTDNHKLNVLLGADLECNRKEKRELDCKLKCDEGLEMGWCNVVKCSDKYKERAKYNYIKAPHHSSVNGYCPEMMDEKVDKENTVITTTVFENGAGVRLPEKSMLYQYLSKCNNYYITASQSKPLKCKDKKTEIEFLKSKGLKVIAVINPECGFITTSFNIGTGKLLHQNLWGSARKVDNDLIDRF